MKAKTIKQAKSAIDSRTIIRIVVVTVLILLVPLLAMLFTDEVSWDAMDFAVIGALLIFAGVAFEFISSKLPPIYKVGVAIVIVLVLLVVWAELAVGIFGSAFAGE